MLERFKSLKESRRLEAKLAAGGFPHSVWETYSAFANTLGGVILLGVEELPDKTLRPVRLDDPCTIAREFERGLNDKAICSVNILEPDDIWVVLSGGGAYVAIFVPRAPSRLRPVYIGRDPKTGSYRRVGDGDYRISPRRLERLLRRQRKAERRYRFSSLRFYG